MAIRIRKLSGITVALCAAETNPEEGDIYLDDTQHYALSQKYSIDYNLGFTNKEFKKAMDSQKLRDAEDELIKWLKENEKKSNIGS